MFEELLNKEVRAFIKRATDKTQRWGGNIIRTDITHAFYVEYYQERLYWVYSYNNKIISMVYASNPSEAVKIASQNNRIIVLTDNSNYTEKIDNLVLKDDD